MRWIHISDIHYNPEKTNSDTTLTWKKLPEFLDSNQLTVDAVFMTGAFRYAKEQPDTIENAILVADAFKKIAVATGVQKADGTVDAKRIFTVPGNHDLDRDYQRRKRWLDSIREDYLRDIDEGIFDEADLRLMQESFTFYKRVHSYLYGDNDLTNYLCRSEQSNPHSYVHMNGVNLLLLNSALFAMDSYTIDRHAMVIGHTYVTNLLQQMQDEHPNCPIIVLSHHAMDQLHDDEKKKIQNIFHQYPVKLYLCGHSYEVWHTSINNTEHLTMGCIKHEKGVKASFSIGEYDRTSGRISISVYEWRYDINPSNWYPYPGIGKNGSSILIIDTNSNLQNNYYKYINHEISQATGSFQLCAHNFSREINHGNTICKDHINDQNKAINEIESLRYKAESFCKDSELYMNNLSAIVNNILLVTTGLHGTKSVFRITRPVLELANAGEE
jgi:hypothetical protein